MRRTTRYAIRIGPAHDIGDDQWKDVRRLPQRPGCPRWLKIGIGITRPKTAAEIHASFARGRYVFSPKPCHRKYVTNAPAERPPKRYFATTGRPHSSSLTAPPPRRGGCRDPRRRTWGPSQA